MNRKQEKPNRETTKNILRGRTCETCARKSRWGEGCELYRYKPELGVCSQWKMSWQEAAMKNRRHKENVRKKRQAKKAVEKVSVQA